ncbi:MAG: phage head morphogenesis protein [Treponematales bacterium]
MAHSDEADVVDTIFRILNESHESGAAFGTVKSQFLDMMRNAGWYGKKGKENDKEYINWRICTIYETNMRTAYSAQAYQKQLEGAEKAGIVTGDSDGMDLPEIDPTWAYNVGQEALAPNFAKYRTLKENGMLREVVQRYRDTMRQSKMTYGQLSILLDKMRSKEYGFDKHRAIQCQIGNLEGKRADALQLNDSKVMITEERIHHAFREKEDVTIPEDCYSDAYDTLQSPEIIYKEKTPRHGEAGEVYHFVKNTRKGKIINAILEKAVDGTSLRVETIDLEEKDRLLGARDLNKVWEKK